MKKELDSDAIMQMTAKDFNLYKFIKVKIELSKDIKILNKQGKIFTGFISGISLSNGTDDASNPILMPAKIIFVDENVSSVIDKKAEYSGAKSILITVFKKITIIDTGQVNSAQ